MENRVNRRILDYEVLRRLGFGGMGEVLQVRHMLTGRIEAMKVLLPNYVGNRQRQERFLREIQTLEKLKHPNIAQLCNAATFEDQIVMIMDYVDGVTVESMVDGNPLPVGKAVRYMMQALQALAYAHRQGVVHRDFKPANLMVTADGTVKLMDFGIALTEGARLTQNGSTVGTFYFMSPEQARGEEVDGRSDIYAAGVTLYEMVTGRTPFTGTTPNTLMDKHVNEAPTPPSAFRAELPPALNDVILKMLAKAPRDRYQTADEAREALEASVPAVVRTQEDNQTPGQHITTTEMPAHNGAVVGVPIDRSGTSDETVGRFDPGIRIVVPVQPPAPARGWMWIQIGVVVAVLAGAGYGMYAFTQHDWSKSKQAVVAPVEPKPATSGLVVPPMNSTTGGHGNGKVAGKPGVPTSQADLARVKAEQARLISGNVPHGGADKSVSGIGTRSGGSGTSVVVVDHRDPGVDGSNVSPLPRTTQQTPAVKLASRQLDDLNIEATAASEDVDRKKQEMEGQGLHLRSAVTTAQSRMIMYCAKARQALQANDVAEADSSMAQAKAELATIRSILPR